MGWSDRKKVEPQSGPEMALRLAMKVAGVNPDEVFEQVKRFAENGTLEKILLFAEAVEFNNFLLGTIYNEFRKQNPELPDIASAYRDFKSRAGSGNGEPGQPAANRLAIASGSNSSV